MDYFIWFTRSHISWETQEFEYFDNKNIGSIWKITWISFNIHIYWNSVISQNAHDTFYLQEKILCRVCFDEQINVVLLPCRHYALCRYHCFPINPFSSLPYLSENLKSMRKKKRCHENVRLSSLHVIFNNSDHGLILICSTCCEKCKRCPICRVYIDERLLVHDDV